MLEIYLQEIQCDEETNEVGADEPYVLVTTVDLTGPVPGYEVFQYGPYGDVDEGEARPGELPPFVFFGKEILPAEPRRPFWGRAGKARNLANPDDAIFIVSLMENDNGSPSALRGIVKGLVGASVFGSTGLDRAQRVKALINDIGSALNTPTGFPNGDDRVGPPTELRFTQEELARAEAGQRVERSLAFEGDGGAYKLTFRARNPDSWRRWFQIEPRARFNQITPVAAVARRPDHMDIFKIGFDGAVWSSWWHADDRGWRDWFPIHPRTIFAQEAPITAVARRADHLDLFVTGFNGAIWSSWWHEDDLGWRDWFQIHPETVFRQDRPVAAVARMPEHMDIFRVGFDGAVWSSWWHGEGDPGGWRPWFRIEPATLFPTEARVSALARREDQLDLFIVGHDGAVWSSWWHEGRTWAPWFQIHPETVFPHDQQIASVGRAPEQIDIFTIGHDGAVWSSWWHGDGDPGGWRPWFQIHPETRFPTRAQVSAISREPDHMDLFVTGQDNAVWSCWWHADEQGWRPWFQLHPQTRFSQEHAVAVTARRSDQMDLFKVGFDGAVWSAWWSPD
jgi:hypothetical protein